MKHVDADNYELAREWLEWLKRGASRSTTRDYAQRVQRFLEWLEDRPLATVTVEDVEEWCYKCTRGGRAQGGRARPERRRCNTTGYGMTVPCVS